MKKDSLKKIREHNVAQYKGDKVGTLKRSEVIECYEETLGGFATELIETREGKLKDRYGRNLAANDVSLSKALGHHYGIYAPEKDMNGYLTPKQKAVYVIRKFLRQMDVSMSTDTLYSTAQRFGNSNLTSGKVESLLVGHGEFDALNNTQQIPGDFRFIIPEIILAAIRIDYEAASMHSNWISNTINITQREAVMPQILRGNATPRRIQEAESIPFGTVRFGQKKATVYKVGVGFKITDELIEGSTLDMIFEFLGEVGTDMSIGADVEAYSVLRNGEQANGSESAPVIGVDTTGAVGYRDIRRAVSRMKRLKRMVNRILTGEEEGIDLSLLDEFKGFDGGTTLANFQTILGLPPTLVNDVWAMPSNETMFLDPTSAMVKLKYRSMKTERRRNPQNQEDEIFVSDYIGYAIKRRDGRLVIDKDLDFAGNGFPEYMDIDSRISEAFKHKNE